MICLLHKALVAEVVNQIFGLHGFCFIVVTPSYILSRFIKNTTFCSPVVSIGHEYGWDVVKSLLLTMFIISIHQVIATEGCCAFLKEMVT